MSLNRNKSVLKVLKMFNLENSHTVRPLLVMVELDGKLTGATVAFQLTGTGVASPEFMVGVAH